MEFNKFKTQYHLYYHPKSRTVRYKFPLKRKIGKLQASTKTSAHLDKTSDFLIF